MSCQSCCSEIWRCECDEGLPVRLLLSMLYSWTGDSFSVFGMRRVVLACAVLWLSGADEPLAVLVLGPLRLLWLCRGVKTGMAAGHRASWCSCDEAPATCVLLLDCCKTQALCHFCMCKNNNNSSCLYCKQLSYNKKKVSRLQNKVKYVFLAVKYDPDSPVSHNTLYIASGKRNRNGRYMYLCTSELEKD